MSGSERLTHYVRPTTGFLRLKSCANRTVARLCKPAFDLSGWAERESVLSLTRIGLSFHRGIEQRFEANCGLSYSLSCLFEWLAIPCYKIAV